MRLLVVAVTLLVIAGGIGWAVERYRETERVTVHASQCTDFGTDKYPAWFVRDNRVWVSTTDRFWGTDLGADARFTSDETAEIEGPAGSSSLFHLDRDVSAVGFNGFACAL